MSKPYFWMVLAAAFLVLNALMLARVGEPDKGGAIRAATIGLTFR